MGYIAIDRVQWEAAKNGHLNIIEWLVDIGIKLASNFQIVAASNGHLHLLKWAKNNGYSLDSSICSYAVNNNHLNILIWARENGVDWNNEVCINGHLKHNIHKYLIKNNCPCGKLNTI